MQGLKNLSLWHRLNSLKVQFKVYVKLDVKIPEIK